MLAAEISALTGIVNGTTNYILTEMARRGLSYAEALKRAQDLGYAEADPTEDVGGADAAAKMAILASIAFHTNVHFDDVAYEGIDGVHAEDLELARDLGFVVKLLGVARLADGGISVRVHPALVPERHRLAAVMGPDNAVLLESGTVRQIMLVGPGAGGTETASAVLADVLSILGTRQGQLPAERAGRRRAAAVGPGPDRVGVLRAAQGRRPTRRARADRDGLRRGGSCRSAA